MFGGGGGMNCPVLRQSPLNLHHPRLKERLEPQEQGHEGHEQQQQESQEQHQHADGGDLKKEAAASLVSNLILDLHQATPPPTPTQTPPSPSAVVTSGLPKKPFPACLVDKYLLLEQPGLGHHHLYKCVNIDTQEEFACKIVNSEAYRPTISAYLLVDGHEHINEIVEAIVGPSHTYMIFSRSHGDLHSYVRTRRRLRETEARDLFRQVASAVHHCHENGIVLRDLKLLKFVFRDPEKTQLKLETLEDAIVIDDDNDQLSDKHGCPAYVSPEILVNRMYSGKAVDMWSLGVMLYTMLVGRYPFHDKEPGALFLKIRCGHYVIPDTVSPKAKCLIRSLLRHDPSERLTASDVLAHPWLNSPVSVAPKTGLGEVGRSRAPCSRSPDQIVPEMAFVAVDGIGTINPSSLPVAHTMLT